MVEVSFGEWLKRRRKSVGLTQEQLAQQLNCSTITLRKIESEERRPSAQIVEQLAEVFDVPKNEQTSFRRFARGDWQSAPAKESKDEPWRASTVSTHSNLPATLTSLIGRGTDIAFVREYLLSIEIRLVTLVGPPGIGKTRLSLEVAHEVLHDFPDGTFFIALAPLEDPSFIAPTMVQTLGFVETKNQPSLERLREGIGDKKMLIVLDNIEHLIQETATLVPDILSACPRLKILATSREALRVPGEWIYLVPTLNIPATAELPSIDSKDLEEISQFAALMLFAERARAVRSDFTLNTDNIRAVTEICIQLDGLPLAIELIAARIRLMSAPALLAKLTDQFVLSANGMRAAPTRQKTLHNAIGWSYNLLSPEEQGLFARLSVFSGGFALDAAETIFSRTITSKSISDLIALLLDKSLLQYAFDHKAHGESRFTMLVTIQQFALDQLHRMGEESEVRDWHLDYFLALAEEGELHMYGHGQVEWLARLQTEMDNFRAAFEWSLGTKNPAEKSLRLANSLFHFWRIRSEYDESRHWLETVMNLPEAEHYPNMYVKSLLNLGMLELIYVDSELAEPLLTQSVMLARTLADDQILAEALDFLGLDLGFQKKFERAHALLEESQSLFQAANNQRGIALTNWHLGWVTEFEGDRAAAFEFAERALELFEELGDILRQSIVSRDIAEYFLATGEPKRGIAMLRQALSKANNVGSKLEMGTTFWILATAQEQQGNLTKAVQFFWTAQKLYTTCGKQGLPSDMEKELGRLRANLDGPTFEAAITQAQSWTIEQAVAHALEEY